MTPSVSNPTSNQAPETQKQKFISIQIKVLAGFTLLFSLVFAGAYYWFYRFTTAAVLEQIQEDLVTTLESAADGVDADDLLALSEEGQPRTDGYTDDPRYWENAEWLASVENIEPRAKLYTYRMAADDAETVIFITSGSAASQLYEGAQFLQRLPLSSDIERDFYNTGLQSQKVNMTPFTDNWGRWVSGAMPLQSESSTTMVAIGVDFEASYVLEVQQRIQGQMGVAFLITYVTLFGLVLIVSRVLTRPLLDLKDRAEQISEGNYSEKMTAITRQQRFQDEITILAETFDVMVGKVRQREENLKQQVTELKIEIDQAKRQKHVQEVIDSDFFQDLQVRAKLLRGKFRGSAANPAEDSTEPPPEAGLGSPAPS